MSSPPPATKYYVLYLLHPSISSSRRTPHLGPLVYFPFLLRLYCFFTFSTAALGAKGPADDGQAEPGGGVAREEKAAAVGETEKAGTRGGGRGIAWSSVWQRSVG